MIGPLPAISPAFPYVSGAVAGPAVVPPAAGRAGAAAMGDVTLGIRPIARTQVSDTSAVGREAGGRTPRRNGLLTVATWAYHTNS